MTSFAIHDAVQINTANPPLTGVILHHGPVQFAAGSWIGIRLTGASAGKGKNDGSVDGTRYFDADDKCGLFMKSEKAEGGGLEKRTLSRLEELRLKRELEGKASSGASAAVSPVRTRSQRSGGDSSASKQPSAEKESALSDRRKELRLKREALAKERMGKSEEDAPTEAESVKVSVSEDVKETAAEETNQETTQPPINLSHATPGYKAELARLQSKIFTLQSELNKKVAENASLQSSLDFMSKGAEQSTHDAVRMYALGALALSEKKSPSKARTTVKTPGEESRNLNDDLSAEGESDSEEESEDEEDNEQVVNQAAAAVSQALVDRNNELMAQLSEMTRTKTNLEHELSEAQERMCNMTHKLQALVEKLENEKQARSEEQQSFSAEKSTMASQMTSLQREYSILQDRLGDKSGNVSEVNVAKLKAEITTLQRKNTELENEKLDMETTLEELVLDKEALKEENEMISDQLEEMKIDLESTQLELEDVKGQLPSDSADAVEGVVVEGSDSDAARSLTLQNTRLRTAIIRLREQAEQEKNDLQKQLKALQSDSTSKEALQLELEELKVKHVTAVKEVKELKDIVDQTTSLEETIESLSDKVWNLEQDNANLERTIRELEESAEIAAEMEEVQSDELKCVMRDLEGRDAVIRNLEEAIRMQRRREEDFQRYVSHFRSSISTLKQEKAALLALTEGEQGERSHLMATSQKALAQAAQLAADASAARKRDCDAVFDRIDARSATYLCQRIESLLPSGVVSAELAAVKGEIDLSMVADKAAVSLSTLQQVFEKGIEKGLSGVSEFNVLEEGTNLILSDGSAQQISIATMIHQAEFASLAIGVASDALRFMAAGQWPDLMSEDLSTDMGSVVVHSISQLDLSLSEQLKLLKQEGALSPLRSSLSELNQSAQNTKLALFSISDQLGKPVIPSEWNPPALLALKSLSLGRFHCLGATAVLASAICPFEKDENEPPAPTLANLAAVLEKAKLSCSNVSDVCKKFSGLGLNNLETIESLNELASKYQTSSRAFFDCVKVTFTQQSISSDDVVRCASLLEEVVTLVRQLSALLRKADLGEHDSSNFHELSPEYGDSWGGVARVVAQVRAVDGDPEDVNYLMRARAIEQQLTNAVQNGPKLEKANARIASLEKSLASRYKEIAMQNSRISELESLITKSSPNLMSPVKGIKTPGSPSADTHKLKEEVRVLQEALDVMQQQADEYEKEIRILKDKSKTPRVSRQTSGRITPNKSSSVVDLEATLGKFGTASKAGGVSSRDIMLESISLETALFRPALASATQSASYWKAQSMGSALSKLAPLNVQLKSHCNNQREKSRCVEEVALAKNEMRLAKASFSVVDLSNTVMSPRQQLHDEIQKERAAESRLQDATMSVMNQLSLEGKSSAKQTTQSMMCGKIIIPCREDTAGYVASMSVSRAELREFHSFLVQ